MLNIAVFSTDKTNRFRTGKIAWNGKNGTLLPVPTYAQGDVIRGYIVLRKLGEGGLGVVYLARDAGGTLCALKITRPYTKLSLTALHEAQIMLAYGKHPGLPGVHAAWLDGGCAYTVMDFLPGRNLHTITRKKAIEPFPVPVATKILAQLLKILHHIHSLPQPIYHMDVKPSNIMVDRHGRISLLDFGISQCAAVGVWSPKRKDMIVGTWSCMPPEHILSSKKRQLNPLADIFGAGVVGYILTTGRYPRTISPDQVSSPADIEIPPILEYGDQGALAQVINRATVSEPTHRFQTAEHFLRSLERV